MKKIKIFVGVFLCMNLFTISGCDKVVHSAVVEEKDKTAAKKEENKEKETVQKTVTEQVQAPKTYQPEWIFWSFVPIGAGCMILHFIEFCLDFCCKTDSAKNTDNSTKSNMNTITTDKKEGK